MNVEDAASINAGVHTKEQIFSIDGTTFYWKMSFRTTIAREKSRAGSKASKTG